MSNLNKIGLDKSDSKIVVQKLNELLANYSVFYQNVRGYHWNIKGENFFELHQKFEELYDNLFSKIDEIAERILTLGSVPNHAFSAYYKLSEIEDSDYVSDGVTAIKQILDSLKVVINLQREILDISADSDDEGTNAIMSDYIREQEKLHWMYSAYVNK